MDIRKWFDLFSFDVMGDLSFGEGFQCLEQGRQHWVIEHLTSMQDNIGMFVQSWAFAMLAAIPGLSRALWTFVNFCGEKLMDRFEVYTYSSPVPFTIYSMAFGPDSCRIPLKSQISALHSLPP